jgi:hypothetical protein
MWEGGGDNYWHYYFSRYAYKFPEFFLHHWGKPLFILLSCPFAQFGFYGINVFNIVCGLLSAWITYRFCKELGLNSPWLAIIITLCTPVYFLILQSAMTEPLFSLVFIYTAYLLYKEKYAWGAIIASSVLFSRSEGMFVILVYAVYLLLMRKWKYVPLLGVTFLLYSIIGYFSGHNFFWYFTENPYAEISGYGHGTWDHFFLRYRIIWGRPGCITFVVGFLVLAFLIFRNREYNIFKPLQKNMKVLLLVFFPVLIFSVFHIYAWAEGKYASAGLERVFSCVVPGMTIISMYSVSLLNTQRFHFAVRAVFTIAFLYVFIPETNSFTKYPLVARGPEKVNREAARWFLGERKPGKIVYYAHPAILLFCNYDPFDRAINRECHNVTHDCNFNPAEPFYYFWDSAFSEIGPCGMKLNDLKKCPNLKLLRVFGDGTYALFVFEYSPPKL